MSRQEIVKRLKKKNPNINSTDLENILDIFNEFIEEALVNNESVEIRGFGTFFTKRIKEKHSSRNPRTGELIYVPEKKKVRFRASKKLKIYINK